MSITTNILSTVIGTSACMEIGARVFYKKKFQMPWRSKVIGEYPYNEFVEKVEPPIYFQFKKGYRSKYVNINRFGMRSAEPVSLKDKKKLVLIGESLYFGPKLLNEKELWCYNLQKILQKNNIKNWEIFNMGFPGYNSYQYLAWWEKIKSIKPDVLIFEFGANDISQAYVMGERWQPGTPWPWEFLLRQQRKSKWWQKLLFHSCFYFWYRRKKLTERKGFEAGGKVFKLDECIESVIKNGRKIISDAKAMGTKVILSTVATAYDLNCIKEKPPQLDAIQSNWKENFETSSVHMVKFNLWWAEEFSKQVNCPSFNLQKATWSHPKRYEMFLDVAHMNEMGHRFIANEIFKRLDELKWW